MSVQRFLNYVVYSNICPAGVSEGRWRAMLKWFEIRQRLEEPFCYS